MNAARLKEAAYELVDVANAVAGIDAEWHITYHQVYCFAQTLREALDITSAVGGTWDKQSTPYFFELSKSFGDSFDLVISLAHEAVCTAETIIEEVEEPDPNAPKVLVKREKTIWHCPESLLAVKVKGV